MIKKIREEAKKRNAVIVFPEGDDERVKKAVEIIEREKIARTIVLEEGSIEERVEKGMNLVKEGKADGLVTGASHPTKLTLLKAFKIIGKEENVKKVSGAFLVLKEKPLLFADCAVNINPNSEELAEIALLSAKTFHLLTKDKARIAMLSFSTKGSAEHEFVEKVRKATEIVRKLDKDIEVEGEVQVDAALSSEVARLKSTELKGEANILIFPDLQSGNIGYKILERLGNVGVIGPILQGLKKPVNDLSRGCRVEDIVNLAAITALQS